MKRYIITVEERWHGQLAIEADTREEAEATAERIMREEDFHALVESQDCDDLQWWGTEEDLTCND